MRKALIMLSVAAIAAMASASANAAECGPLSKWTGQVCIGPHGKAYCPLDMTMQGDTCVATATTQSRVAKPPGPSNAPAAGMKIFHSGNAVQSMHVPPGGPPAGNIKLGAGIQPFIATWKLTAIEPAKFTLTPNQPEIQGSGDLGCSECYFVTHQPNNWDNGSIILSNLPSSNAYLEMEAVAGTTYVIDVTVTAFGAGATATVTGPDGSQESFMVGNDAAEHHLVFAYQALTTGSGDIAFLIQANKAMNVYGVTVAPVQ